MRDMVVICLYGMIGVIMFGSYGLGTYLILIGQDWRDLFETFTNTRSKSLIKRRLSCGLIPPKNIPLTRVEKMTD